MQEITGAKFQQGAWCENLSGEERKKRRFLKKETPDPVSPAQMKNPNKDHHSDENWH